MKLNELVFKLLTNSVNKNIDTSEFKNLKHNIDLVPRFERNLKYLIDIFGKYRDDCYDIQGIKDEGIDVLFKYFDDENEHKIGLQIKSFDDLKNDDWMSKLKAQLFETSKIWKTEDLYVVFCTDVTTIPQKGPKQIEKDKVRNAIAEIERASEEKIHIIQPTEAMWFYMLDEFSIFQCVFSIIHNFDTVYKKACRDVNELTEEELKCVIDVIVDQFLEGRDDYTVGELLSKNDDINGDFLYFNNFILVSDSDFVKYRYDNNWELTSFVVEVRSRYLFSNEKLKIFLFNQIVKANKK